MLVELNSTYNISLEVKDGGKPILDDTPFCTIKDLKTGKYYNGLFWADSKVELSMAHLINGVYTMKFVPDTLSKFEINCRSARYNISKTETIESHTDDWQEVTWQVGCPYDLVRVKSDAKLRLRNIDSGLKLIIHNPKTNLYYSKDGWVSEHSKINMQEIQNGIYVYSFVPEDCTKYNIKVVENMLILDKFILNVVDKEVDNTLRVIGSKTIKAQDGSDTTVIGKNGAFIPGVKVTCYNKDKEIVSTAQTDQVGEWTMRVMPGKYLFVFEKDEYVTISLEREVL